MAENSKIEWTDHTFNPWIGCAKVHEGCTNCYAEADMDKRRGRVKWGPAGTRSKTSEDYWKQPLRWNREAEASGVRARVFCASLADVFEDWRGPIHMSDGTVAMTAGTPEVWRWATMSDLRRDLFELIDATPWLDWLLLTKRPENVRGMWYRGNHPPKCPIEFQNGDIFASALAHFRFNVWIGTSVSNQVSADKQISELVKCRDLAPVLFLSAEPLLEKFILRNPCPRCAHLNTLELPNCQRCRAWITPFPIDWLIAGGESGPKARPCDVEWIRFLVHQCEFVGVAPFVKQLGARAFDSRAAEQVKGSKRLFTRDELEKPIERAAAATILERTLNAMTLDMKDPKGGDWDEWPEALRIRKFPEVTYGR